MELFKHSHKSMDDLLHQDSYTPEELATLLDESVDQIRTACFEGEMKCKVVNHHIVSIERNDALAWARTQSRHRKPSPNPNVCRSVTCGPTTRQDNQGLRGN